MVFDLVTILCIIASAVVGALIFYAVYTNRVNAIDTIYDKMSALYASYGEDLAEKDPDLAKEVEMALKAMGDALVDDKISALEALDISSKFFGVFKQLSEFVQKTKK